MVLKTFNLDEETYKKFSEYCRDRGISMSKQIDLFIKAQLAESDEDRQVLHEKLGLKTKEKTVKKRIIF